MYIIGEVGQMENINKLSAKITDSVREILKANYIWPIEIDNILFAKVDEQINKILSEFLNEN